jgi:MoaA/NifB/PqqE/SkfB family radical SAM enzyme
MVQKIYSLYKYFFDDKPLNISLTMSFKCNLRCKQCKIWKNQSIKTTTLEQKFTIIDKLSKWLGRFCLNIVGGEPFANPRIFDVIDYAIKKRSEFL